MEYTTLGKTGLKVSRLGFGCMRLPMNGGVIDRDLAIPMLRRAFDLGITYFDTAVMYCGGDSQRALGEAMEDIRDKVVLSTKNHHYDKADKAGWWKNLEDSLKFLRTDCIDVYNFHGMNFETYEGCVGGEDGLFKEVMKAKEQGMVRHVCHSFHGSLESLKNVIDLGLFESVTLQYNLLDQSLEEGIAYAHEHNVGVTVMGPVGGGRLGYPSEKAAELVGEVKSTPELALRFVLSNPGVCVALSGMSTMQQLEENVATVSQTGDLSEEDHRRIEAAVQERKQLSGLYCTGCNYCMPCPEGVNIPANFEIMNLERIFGLTEHAKSRYAALSGKAALCRLCGKCVEPCPQDLAIPERLAEAVGMLDERAGSVAGWSEMLGAEAAEGGMVNVKLRYHLKNFTDQAYEKVNVHVQSHREEQVDARRLRGQRRQALRPPAQGPAGADPRAPGDVEPGRADPVRRRPHAGAPALRGRRRPAGRPPRPAAAARRRAARALAAASRPGRPGPAQGPRLRLRRLPRRRAPLPLGRRRRRPALPGQGGDQGPRAGRQPAHLPGRPRQPGDRPRRLRGRRDARHRLPAGRGGRRAAGGHLQRVRGAGRGDAARPPATASCAPSPGRRSRRRRACRPSSASTWRRPATTPRASRRCA